MTSVQAADTALHRRLPQKLVASWRNGYGAVRSKTIPVPRKLTTLLRPCLTGDPLALDPPACPANGDMPVSRPSGEAAGNACEGTDGSTEGRGSEGERAAAAATAALEEVGQAISASVVAQAWPCTGCPERLFCYRACVSPSGMFQARNQ